MKEVQKKRLFLNNIRKNLHYSSSQINMLRQFVSQIKDTKTTSSNRKYPTLGTRKLLVILAGFSDLSFTYTQQDFQSLVSQQGYDNWGSVQDYYRDNSNGQLNLQIDVVGPYNLSHTMSYYGADTTDYHDVNAHEFIYDAINAADNDVNYADYDNDSNGVVDDVHVIFAGTPQSSTGNTNEIWPHSSGSLGYYYPTLQKDGKHFGHYSCSAEKSIVGYNSDGTFSTEIDNIGTLCHEFGHVLGLPDFYDTDYQGTNGQANDLGHWDLMASGSYNNGGQTPPCLSAEERIMLNWMHADTLSSSQDSVFLPILADSNIAYFVNNIVDNNHFFLIENRQMKGWDSFIPGGGMIVFHGDKIKINAWINNWNNTINVDPNDRGFYIEVANGVDGNYNTSYAPFPGRGNVNYFTGTSPNTHNASHPITNIRYVNDSVMKFDYMSSRPAVVTNKVTSYTSTSFIGVGQIVYYGNTTTLTNKGIAYSTNSNCPINSATKVYDNTLSSGNISVNVTGLNANTTYYYRAFAQTASGIGVGEVRKLGEIDTAKMTASIIDVTDSTAKIITRMGNNTSYYYLLHGSLNGLSNAGITDVTTAASYCINNGYTQYTQDYNGARFVNLTPNLTYKVYVLPYNANNQMGTPIVITYTTQQTIATAMVAASVFNITDTTASLTTTIGNNTSHYYLVWGTQSQLSSLGVTNVITASNYCITNNMTQYTNSLNNLSLTGLTPNTSYTLYALPYNDSNQLGTAAVITFTTTNNTATAGPPIVTISNVTSTVSSDNHTINLSFSITKNLACQKYQVVVANQGQFEGYQSAGYTIPFLIDYFINQGYGNTAYSDTTISLSNMTPGLNIEIYVNAIKNTDTNTFTSNYTTAVGGGQGTATLSMNIPSVQDTTAHINILMGNQSAYYYLGIYKQSDIAQYNYTQDSVRILLENNDSKYSVNFTNATIGEERGLEQNTEYIVYAFPYNHNNQLGTVPTPIHFITGQGVISSGINTIDNSILNVSLYPNPTKKDATLTIDGLVAAAQIVITDIQGKIIKEQTITSNQKSIVISRDNLVSGIYYIKIITKDNNIITKKLIIE